MYVSAFEILMIKKFLRKKKLQIDFWKRRRKKDKKESRVEKNFQSAVCNICTNQVILKVLKEIVSFFKCRHALIWVCTGRDQSAIFT